MDDIDFVDDDANSLYPSSPELRADRLLQLRHEGTLEDTLDDEDDDVDVADVVRRTSSLAAAVTGAAADADEVSTPVIDLYEAGGTLTGAGNEGGAGGGGGGAGSDELMQIRDPCRTDPSSLSPFSESRFPSLFAAARASAADNDAAAADFSPSSQFDFNDVDSTENLLREAVADACKDEVDAAAAAAAATEAMSDVHSSGDDRVNGLAELFASPVTKDFAQEFFTPSVGSSTSAKTVATVAAAAAAALSSTASNFRRSSLSAVAEAASSFERQTSTTPRPSPPAIQPTPLIPNGGPTQHRYGIENLE